MRRLILLAFLAGLLGGILASMVFVLNAPAAAREKVLFAEMVGIVDANGKVRASLALGPEGSVGLVLVRPDGQTLSSQLMVNPNRESILTFFDEQGKATRMVHR